MQNKDVAASRVNTHPLFDEYSLPFLTALLLFEQFQGLLSTSRHRNSNARFHLIHRIIQIDPASSRYAVS